MDAKEVLAIVLNRGLQPKIGGFGMLEFDGDPKAMTPTMMAVVRHHEDAIKRLVASQWTPEVKGSGGSIAPKVPLTPAGEESTRFDWDAERLIRDLYATDHGLKWIDGKMSIFPADGDPRLDVWLKRGKPMRERIEAHIRPRDMPTPETIAKCKAIGLDATKYTHGIELKHKDAGKTIKCSRPIRGHDEKSASGTTPDNSRTTKRQQKDAPIVHWEQYDYVTQERFLYVVDEPHPFVWEPPILFTSWRYMMDRCDHWRMLWGRWIQFGSQYEFIRWGERRQDGSRYL